MMGTMRFSMRTFVGISAKALYEWHMRPGAFERLTPPWEDVRILEREGTPSVPGYRAVLSMPLGPWRIRWVAVHRSVEPGISFVDEQLHGPFRRWEHTHRFRENGSGSALEDEIDFELPLGRLGQTLGSGRVLRSLERVFRYRHATTVEDVEAHLRYSAMPRMRVLVTEANGLVGSTLGPFLSAGGHEVVLGNSMDPALFEGVDAVVHSGGRGTRLLSQTLAKLEKRPRVMLHFSTVGFYGDRGASLLDENSTRGSGPLAEACEEEERATEAALAAGIRVVHLRKGIVLNAGGGSLQDALVALRLGLGGPRRSDDFMNWITADEIASVVLHAIATDHLRGPVNVVSPSPLTLEAFTAVLARVLRASAIFSLPRFALRAACGRRADELPVGSVRVVPRKLLATGYRFRHPDLEAALRHILGRSDA